MELDRANVGRTKIQIGQISFSFTLPPSGEEPQLPSRQEGNLPDLEVDSPSGTQKTETRSPSLAAANPSSQLSEPPEKTKRKNAPKEYQLDEIPPEYRAKPQYPYSHLITSAIRAHPNSSGISLSEIYKGIQDLFPYYKYCGNGWKHSVRHNLSSNKAFLKVSKEGKGWLWGMDEKYFKERELLKKRAASKAKASVKPKTETEEPSTSEPSQPLNKPAFFIPQYNSDVNATEPKPAIKSEEPDEESVLAPPGPDDTSLIKKEISKSKTIAELAREIQVSSGNDRLYRPTYNGSTTNKDPSSSKPTATSTASVDTIKATNSIAENEAILNSLQYKQYYPGSRSMPPIPLSISNIPASIGNIRYSPPASSSSSAGTASATALPTPPVKSLADGQSTFRMSQLPKPSNTGVSMENKTLRELTSVPKMRVNPQIPNSVRDVKAPPGSQEPPRQSSAQSNTVPLSTQQQPQDSNQVRASPPTLSSSQKPASKPSGLAHLNLPKETLRVLSFLQDKIKAQMEASGQTVNPAVLTNALAMAIAQLTKGGKGKAGGLAALINGKNQAALVNAIAAAVKKQAEQRRASNPTGERPKVTRDSTPNSSAQTNTDPPDLTQQKITSPAATKSTSPTAVDKKPHSSPSLSASTTVPANDLQQPVVVITKSPPAIAQSLEATTTSSVAKPSPVATSSKATASSQAKSDAKPKAEVIAEMLVKASKLKNPSPSIRAALVQLQAHALKLGLEIPENLKNLSAVTSQTSVKRKASESGIGTPDDSLSEGSPEKIQKMDQKDTGMEVK